MKCGFEAVLEAQRRNQSRQSAGPMVLAFDLPFPPTTNSIWRSVVIGGKGRVLLSKEGREYRVRVSEQLMVQRVPRNVLTGRLAITLRVSAPDRRRYDIDNRIKGLLDALTHCNVIRDDSDIDRITIERVPPTPGGCAMVVIDEIPGAATESGKLFSEPP